MRAVEHAATLEMRPEGVRSSLSKKRERKGVRFFGAQSIRSRLVSGNEFAHASELVVLECLLDLGAAVHHERAVTDNRLGNGFAAH
ncbi:MAG: hypothetical protein JWR19_230 [Pedosphaera sp.]|nr:hypothetical protein [Pedosphaera sp.]